VRGARKKRKGFGNSLVQFSSLIPVCSDSCFFFVGPKKKQSQKNKQSQKRKKNQRGIVMVQVSSLM